MSVAPKAAPKQNLPPPTKAIRVSRYRKPIPQSRPNFIPEQSWLSYNWVEKDPELDFVQWAIADSGMTLEAIERETEARGHKVSRYTLYGWMYKGVKRPHNATIQTVMAVLGWDRPWMRRDTGEYAHLRKPEAAKPAAKPKRSNKKADKPDAVERVFGKTAEPQE